MEQHDDDAQNEEEEESETEDVEDNEVDDEDETETVDVVNGDEIVPSLDESEPETENLNGFLEDYIHGRNHGGFRSDDALVADINEDRDLEDEHEQKNSAQTEEEVDGEEKPELEYA